MHFSTYLIALLSLAISSLAITVTNPRQGTVWSSTGHHTVSWTEVDTDPTTFAVTLVQLGVFKKVLVDHVDGTKEHVTFNAKLPVGNGFQVNIVKSAQEVDTIFAQSPQFEIIRGRRSDSSAPVSL